jgi:hypothetical protein
VSSITIYRLSRILCRSLHGARDGYAFGYFLARCNQLTRAGFDITHSHINAGSANIQLMHVSPVRYRRFFNQTFIQKLRVWLNPIRLAYLWMESQAVKPAPGHVLVAVAPLVKQQLKLAYGEDLAVEVVTPGTETVLLDEGVRQRVRAELGWGRKISVVCLWHVTRLEKA